ncbi:MAG: hypothetical protein SVZ03_00855 [Spirochaetota bacterium]|nr:hypothetical protein [Spirochaetota bacterium]
MARCGDCRNFIPPLLNSAASMGMCKGILDEDGLGKEVNLYADTDGCPKFEEQDRIRTNVSEFGTSQNLRMARGFDEK